MLSHCPHCQQQVNIPEQLFGQRVRCPLCQQVFVAEGEEAPPVVGVAPSRYVEPHRGGLILTLGILSVVICGLLGPFAWAMGRADLEKMRQGQMDKSGWGVTQAGYILGIVGTVRLILEFVFTCLWLTVLAAAVGVGPLGNGLN
jgi:hypothetical protein